MIDTYSFFVEGLKYQVNEEPIFLQEFIKLGFFLDIMWYLVILF